MQNSPPDYPKISTWLDQIGNWNPQLLREIRGKLKLRNLAVAIGISLLFQILMIFFYSQRIPSRECIPELRVFSCVDSWQNWWLEQFRFITWTEPFVLFLSGVYSLIADLSLEDYRGTLNFIRISPRSSSKFLIGKLLGVPLLPYIAIGLLIPYQLTAAIGAKVPIAFLVSFFVLLIATAIFLFSLALLTALLSNWQAKLSGKVAAGALIFSFITFIWITPAFMWWNLFSTWSSFSGVLIGAPITQLNLEWWYLPITANIWISHSFAIANLTIFTVAAWLILQRRFHNPNATLISKGQSYALLSYIEILMLGFAMQSGFSNPKILPESNVLELQLLMLLLIYTANIFVFTSLTIATTPHRQAVFDWVRFGALSTTEEHPSGWSYILRDLIWSDKSPAIVAIILNIIFTHIPLLIWIGTWTDAEYRDRALLVLASFSTCILILALIRQMILFLKTRNPSAWATGAIFAIFFLPVLMMLSLSITPDRYAGIWLFFGFPWIVMSMIKISDIILAFAGQISVIIALTLQLIYQLQRVKMQRT